MLLPLEDHTTTETETHGDPRHQFIPTTDADPQVGAGDVTDLVLHTEILDHLHREEEILEAVQGAEAGHRQEDESVVREDPARRIDKTATQHASVR